MPLYNADALILRTYKLGESDRIVVFLTRDRGKKRGVAKNSRQSRRRFGGALEPLTCGRVGYMERERRDLVSLRYVEPTRSPLSAAEGAALGYAEYFAELLDESAPEADPSEPLFRLGASVVDAMAVGVPIERLARYFEYWVLRLQGVYQADPRLSEDARAFLRRARTVNPIQLGGVNVPGGALRELEACHRRLIAMHLEKELRSVRVLSQMSAGGPRAK